MECSPDDWFAKVGPGNVVPVITDSDTDVFNRHGITADDIVVMLELQARPGAAPYRQAFRLSVIAAEALRDRLNEALLTLKTGW